MKHHKIFLPPEDIYPIDDWRIVQKSFSEKYLAQDETLFAVGNGYLGMRGTLEEGVPCAQRGTFINGFYESWPIHYGEKAYGYAEEGQTMVNLPDTKIVKIYVDDEPLALHVADLVQYERALNMKDGILARSLVWKTPTGKEVQIKSKLLVSMEYRHLALITYEVVVLNASANIIISSKLIHDDDRVVHADDVHDPRKAGQFEYSVLSVEHDIVQDDRIVFGYKTQNSGMTLSCGMDHLIETKNQYKRKIERAPHEGKCVYTVFAQEGQPFRLDKIISYHSSRRADPKDLCNRAERTIDQAITMGTDRVIQSQKDYMAKFWNLSDMEISDSDYRTQQVLRFNLFHICQATARAEGTGVGARGLTGSAYEGHYFWDSEIYVLPFLTYTEPRIARNVLKFRHSKLDQARERARHLNQKGALYPWRTINGNEASAFFAAGTAQYHINADIMYAVRKYVEVTGDEDFLFDCGVEMLIETARLWYDLGCFPKYGDGEFRIHGVTGPDEYTAVVNNNLFTNMMARENLRFAIDTVRRMQKERPDAFVTIQRETQLDMNELDDWQRAADHMNIPYDEVLQIHPQDENFLKREIWDLEKTPIEKFPLLLHYHPLVLYRHQVIKQADVVMAMFLLGNYFTPEQKKRNFDYYEPLTAGDSSLSACIQGVLASELGYYDLARQYFHHTVLMDFGNVAGNVADGAHIASMGGCWIFVVYGLAGLRDYNGQISFNPHLSNGMTFLKFSLCIRDAILRIEITPHETKYLVTEGDFLTITHKGETLDLKQGEMVVRRDQ